MLVGGGDVGKTTIIEAIALLFSPTNATLVSDADYYNRDTTQGFTIEAIISLPLGTDIIFFPEETKRGRAAYLSALAKYSLASFREKHTDIWYRIAMTLANEFDSDPRVLLAHCDYDVITIRELLLTRKRQFPYLSGPKLANYWLYMLACFTDAPLKNKAAITIIPDVHVVRASVRLGIVPTDTTDRNAVSSAWFHLLAGTRIAPVDLHGPLWRWSRLGFPDVALQEL